MTLANQENLNYITEQLNLISNLVYLRNGLSLYDVDILLEDFCAGLLNRVYGWDLRNINFEIRNVPAIDLADDQARVAVQVTSNKSGLKVRDAVETFVRKRWNEKYDRLIMLILVPKQSSYNRTIRTQELFFFDQSKDIWDLRDVSKKIRELTTDRIQEIRTYIEEEFPNNHKHDYELLNQSQDIINKLEADEFYDIGLKMKVLYDKDISQQYRRLISLLAERELSREYLFGYESQLLELLSLEDKEEFQRLSALSEQSEYYEPLYEFCNPYKLIVKLSQYSDGEEAIVDYKEIHTQLLRLNNQIDSVKNELICKIEKFVQKHA